MRIQPPREIRRSDSEDTLSARGRMETGASMPGAEVTAVVSSATVHHALAGLRARLGRLATVANADVIEAFAELDAAWTPFRLGCGGALHADWPGRLTDGMLSSGLCNERILRTSEFCQWVRLIGGDPSLMHRKHWEWAFVAQALGERGMLAAGRRGLGFAVGREALPSLFAAHGCQILATDVSGDQDPDSAWIQAGQHASSLASLHKQDLLTEEEFRARTAFQAVDMRNIPQDLAGFDFHWSACALEHLGSLQAGKDFVQRSYDLLAPGGVAVHTTEYNMDSDWTTIGVGGDIVFRRADIEEIARGIRDRGGRVTLDFRAGRMPADLHVDRPPYRLDPHLRLEIGGYRCTSFGFILEKP